MKTPARIAAAIAVLTLAAGVAHAQDAAPPATSSEETTTEDVMTISIGCIATYDTVVAQGKAGADAARIKTARDFAVMVYKEFSQKSDEQVAEDIKQADALFPPLLADGKTKLEDLRATCDSIFLEMANEAAAKPAA